MSNESFNEYQGKSGVVMAVMSYMGGMMIESYVITYLMLL